MTMTNEEIIRDFRQAASPVKQIAILADLNVCTKKEIAQILLDAGCEGVPKWYTGPEQNPKKAERKPVKAEQKPAKAVPDQTIKADAGKLELRLVPTQIIRDIAEVRMYGNAKYGDSESWRQVEPERYIDALLRHILNFIDDPHGVDEESGIEHYKHAACNLAFLCEMMKGE